MARPLPKHLRQRAPVPQDGKGRPGTCQGEGGMGTPPACFGLHLAAAKEFHPHPGAEPWPKRGRKDRKTGLEKAFLVPGPGKLDQNAYSVDC